MFRRVVSTHRGIDGAGVLTVTKRAGKEEVLMSFTEELLLLLIHTEAGNDFPGLSALLLDGRISGR